MDLGEISKSINYNHSRQVSEISGIIAQKAGFAPAQIEVIREAALLHDIGKIDIPATILNKPAALSDEEFRIVKKHTAIGNQKINSTIDILQVAAIVAKEHHERIDGKGYMGLKGNQINEYAKLISVTDVFDALLSKRAYKEVWDINDVCRYLSENAGTQFDPVYVALLLGTVDEIKKLYDRPL